MPSSPRESGGSLLSMIESWVRSYGFCGTISGASSASPISSTTTASAPTAVRRPANSCQALASRLSAAVSVVPKSVTATISRFLVGEAHARIEQIVHHVDREVDENEHHHHHDQIRDHDRAIEPVDRFDQQLAHARPGEHGLGD